MQALLPRDIPDSAPHRAPRRERSNRPWALISPPCDFLETPGGAPISNPPAAEPRCDIETRNSHVAQRQVVQCDELCEFTPSPSPNEIIGPGPAEDPAGARQDQADGAASRRMGPAHEA